MDSLLAIPEAGPSRPVEHRAPGGDAAMPALAGIAGRLLGVPVVVVLSASAGATRLHVQPARAGGWAPAPDHPLLQRLCEEVAGAAHPLAWRDLSSHPIGAGLDAAGLSAAAGVPMPCSGDSPVRALCVVDRRPREWTDEELCLLQDLACISLGAVPGPDAVREAPGAGDEAREMADGLAAIVEASPLAIVALDADGAVQLWSPAAERMFGWTQEEVLRRPSPTVPPAAAAEHHELRRRALAGERLVGVEAVRRRRDGSAIAVSMSSAPLTAPDGTIRGTMVAVEDITERRKREADLRRRGEFVAMLQDVAVAANESSTLDEAVRRAIDRICEGTRWSLGHALVREGDHLVSSGIWGGCGEDGPPLPEDSDEVRLGRGEGLPGRVLQSGEPGWVEDLSREPLPRGASLQAAGLRAAFAFPILVGAEVAGVLEFFSDQPVAPDLELLDVMRHVGAQLGRVVERERATAALQRSEERFRFLFQHSPLATWVVDAETLALLDVNEAAVRKYGYTRDEFLAIGARELHAPEAMPHAEGVLTRGGAERVPFRHRRKDGSLLDVELTTEAVRFAGRPAVLVSILDVTEQKKADERLRFLETAGRVLGALFEYEDRLESTARLAVPALADFCAIDTLGDDGLLHREKAVHAEPGRGPLLETEPYDGAGAEGVAAALGGEPVLIEDASDVMVGTAAGGAGSPLPVRSVMRLPLQARGRILGVMTLGSSDGAGSFTQEDLSLAAELAARAALLLDNSRLYREAQQSMRAREEILAVVSHELRNPLHAIVVLVDTLLQWLPADSWRSRERRQLESVHQVARQMARLVQDLLDVTRIEGGHFSIRPDREEVGGILDEAMESLVPIAESEGVRLEVVPGEGLDAAYADRQRIAQVIANLVTNAIRVTPRGGAVLVGVQPSGGELVFHVSDAGPGIPRDHLPRLFQRFWRPETAGGLGAGLGLTIARGIVEAHGGRIWVDTSPRGSTFRFTIPAAPGGAREPAEETYDSVVLLPPREHPARDGAAERRQLELAREQAAAERHARFAAHVAADGRRAPMLDGDLPGHLGEQIATALHLGHIHPGDRLPSIRDVSRLFGVTTYAAVHAYEALAAEGMVEKRGRSGMYAASQDRVAESLLGETAMWLVDVLSGAWEHQIKVPHVPELVRRWTAAVRLRAVCVESDLDTRAALCAETALQFGLNSRGVNPEDLAHPGRRGARPQYSDEVQEADLLITTAYHAPVVRACAQALGKPVLVAGMNPEHADTVEACLREGELTVVCVDGRFGERIRSMRGGRYADRVRTVRVDDRAALAALDPSRPVLLTRAAHERLDGAELRPLVPLSPFLAPACARALVQLLVRFNVEARRA